MVRFHQYDRIKMQKMPSYPKIKAQQHKSFTTRSHQAEVSRLEHRDLKSVFGQKDEVTLTHTSLNGKSSGVQAVTFSVRACLCLACQTLPPPPPSPPPSPPPLRPTSRAGTGFAVKTSAHVNSPPSVRSQRESVAPKWKWKKNGRNGGGRGGGNSPL